MPTHATSAPAAGGAAAPVSELAPGRAGLVSLLLGALVVYELLEASLWRGSLWGAHALGFLPWGWWLLAFPAAAALLPPVQRRLAALGESARRLTAREVRVLPWILGAAAALLFWCVRERHLFWGDALPLSINVPQGQAFHPDEPLTLWLQHALYALGRGRWSAASAIAAGSALAGGGFVALASAWLLRRLPDSRLALLATAVLGTQGFTALFHGHVENYSYLAVAVLGFVTSGIDFLERRGRALPPLLWALLAYALHLLGGLLFVPALLLVAFGVARSETRRETFVAAAVALALGVAVAALARGLYGGEWPWMQFVRGVTRVLFQPNDMAPSAFFSARHAADAWSHVVQMGPLSLALVVALGFMLPARRWLATPAGAFAAIAALALYGPALLTGEGNLGAARNWDLFAAPSAAVALAGLLLVTDTAGPRGSARLLTGLLAVSLFQIVPWTVMNLSVPRTIARIELLPLGRGRSQAMLGTYYLNAGELAASETHFRRALAGDSLNVNALSGLGLVLARSGRLAEAERPLATVAALKPTVPQYRRDLALLYWKRNDWGAAGTQLQWAVALDPADAASWLALADCERRLGHPDSAVYALRAAREHDAANAELRTALADSYAVWVASAGARGDAVDFARAWAGFTQEFPDDPRVAAWAPRAEALLKRPAARR